VLKDHEKLIKELRKDMNGIGDRTEVNEKNIEAL